MYLKVIEGKTMDLPFRMKTGTNVEILATRNERQLSSNVDWLRICLLLNMDCVGQSSSVNDLVIFAE